MRSIHTIALVRAPKAGIQHINHQVETSDDVLRSYYFLNERRVPIVFGPGRHPTSGARFLYFKGPDGMIFEYSVGVDEIEDEATHRPRQFGFEPTSFACGAQSPPAWPCRTLKANKHGSGAEGRTAIVCAASQGLARPARWRWPARGVFSLSPHAAAMCWRVQPMRSRLRPATGPNHHCRRNHQGRPRCHSRRLPGSRHSHQQCRRPPPGDFRKFEREDWIKALDGNMLAPIALIKATLDGMITRKFGRIVNVTSHAVKAPVAMLALSERRAQRLSLVLSRDWPARLPSTM
jgi:hypothetical protein